ncbi:MAG: tetratricopeptide repeat protein [Bryobacteraceae bacterium]|nr:tetratricopeptide repeat protein [Bryobacteraceae bacterium]
MEQLRLFLRLYHQPLRAMSDLLDHGSLAAALIGGLAVALASAIPMMFASWRGVGLGAAVLILLPVAMLIVIRWDRLGGAGVVFRRDYVPAAVCVLMAWAACYLPLAAARLLRVFVPDPVAIVVFAYFLFLSAAALRTVMGTGFLHAGIALAAGLFAAMAVRLFPGPGMYLFSPFYLFFAYRLFATDIELTLQGLGSRQRLKRQLEAAAINPRDGDAQFQLGLIYQQRRNYAAAIPHFEKAVAIDPSEAGPHFELGRIAREQQRLNDARAHFEKAAAIDNKHSSSEVLREFGATSLALSRPEEALGALEVFCQRRPFDPEGQYWYGMTLRRLNREQEARQAFQAAVEAVDTAPGHRRRQVSGWKSLAEKELRMTGGG